MQPLHIGVEEGRMTLSQGEDEQSFGFDETDQAKQWLQGREYPIALCSSSIDHPEDYGATFGEVDPWLKEVFEPQARQ